MSRHRIAWFLVRLASRIGGGSAIYTVKPITFTVLSDTGPALYCNCVIQTRDMVLP